jgi:hypothetical protein
MILETFINFTTAAMKNYRPYEKYYMYIGYDTSIG